METHTHHDHRVLKGRSEPDFERPVRGRRLGGRRVAQHQGRATGACCVSVIEVQGLGSCPVAAAQLLGLGSLHIQNMLSPPVIDYYGSYLVDPASGTME
jgi:hypothetical protein